MRKLIFTLHLLIFLSGCASTVNLNYNKTDIDPAAMRAYEKNPNSFYRIDPRYSTDVMTAFVRMNVFNSSTTQGFGEIVASFWLHNKEGVFECDRFYSKLTEDQKKTVRAKMKSHPFICNNSSYLIEDAEKSFRGILESEINTNYIADAHRSSIFFHLSIHPRLRIKQKEASIS